MSQEGSPAASPKPKPPKAPSPRVIACEAILRALRGIEERTQDNLTQMMNSRVSVEKREKVLVQVAKMTKALEARCLKAVKRFRG